MVGALFASANKRATASGAAGEKVTERALTGKREAGRVSANAV